MAEDLTNNINDENVEIKPEEPVKKKRGRKPKDKKDRVYFGEREEQAVLDYLNSESFVEKNKIYSQILEPAFKKMVESIIRSMKLYIPGEEFIDTYNDTVSNLLTKASKYDPNKGARAYSYYSNVCKNYLLGRIDTYNKTLIRNPSYDTLDLDLSNDIKYSNKNNKNRKIAQEVLDRLSEKITFMLNNPSEYPLKENETKLGKALIKLFDEWDFVLSTDGSNKLNKGAIYFFLKEQTGLDTKGVRDSMKKFKNEFLIIKNYVIT